MYIRVCTYAAPIPTGAIYSHHLISGASALSKGKEGYVSVPTKSPYIYRLGPDCCCYWECCCYSLTVVSHSGLII